MKKIVFFALFFSTATACVSPTKPSRHIDSILTTREGSLSYPKGSIFHLMVEGENLRISEWAGAIDIQYTENNIAHLESQGVGARCDFFPDRMVICAFKGIMADGRF